MKLKDYIALAETVELDKEDEALIVLAGDKEEGASLVKGKGITVLAMLATLLSDNKTLLKFVRTALTYVQIYKPESKQKGGDA